MSAKPRVVKINTRREAIEIVKGFANLVLPNVPTPSSECVMAACSVIKHMKNLPGVAMVDVSGGIVIAYNKGSVTVYCEQDGSVIFV